MGQYIPVAQVLHPCATRYWWASCRRSLHIPGLNYDSTTYSDSLRSAGMDPGYRPSSQVSAEGLESLVGFNIFSQFLRHKQQRPQPEAEGEKNAARSISHISN